MSRAWHSRCAADMVSLWRCCFVDVWYCDAAPFLLSLPWLWKYWDFPSNQRTSVICEISPPGSAYWELIFRCLWTLESIPYGNDMWGYALQSSLSQFEQAPKGILSRSRHEILRKLSKRIGNFKQTCTLNFPKISGNHSKSFVLENQDGRVS